MVEKPYEQSRLFEEVCNAKNTIRRVPHELRRLRNSCSIKLGRNALCEELPRKIIPGFQHVHESAVKFLPKTRLEKLHRYHQVERNGGGAWQEHCR